MISDQNTPAEILDFNNALSVVFSRFGVDAEQEKTIENVCEQYGINTDFFLEVLKVYNGEGYKLDYEKFKSFSLEDVLDYLKRTHDFYLNKKLLEIEQTIELLKTTQPEGSQIVDFLEKFFADYQKKFSGHIKYEETYLFPYVEKLINKEGDDAYALEKFEAMHDDDIENKLTELRETITEFYPQLIEDSQFRLLLLQLHTFEKDLRIHGLIEDNVLLPKAKALEAAIKGK